MNKLREEWETKYPEHQTRWLAYCAETHQHPKVWTAYLFTNWISRRVSEYEANHHCERITDQADFSEWLWNMVENNLAFEAKGGDIS